MWLHSLKVAQLLRSAAYLHTNQSRSYLNHLVVFKALAMMAGHVVHVGEARDAFKAFGVKPEGNRPFGVLGCEWWDNVQINFKQI